MLDIAVAGVLPHIYCMHSIVCCFENEETVSFLYSSVDCLFVFVYISWLAVPIA